MFHNYVKITNKGYTYGKFNSKHRECSFDACYLRGCIFCIKVEKKLNLLKILCSTLFQFLENPLKIG